MTGRHRLVALVREVLRFLVGTCLGLTVDLGVFEAAVRLGAAPGVANVLSSGCAVVVMYLVVTRYVFRADRSPSSFAVFVGYYAVSIATFSIVIQILHETTGWLPFICKLVSLPLSFAANFVFSKVIFRRSGRPSESPSDRPLAGRDVVEAREATR
ncbi:GtrA family protein [Blastococcus sp. TBT05-19]|uniref:GtrA family protein n=1 Tax=Blastococcus sp. TBT05-19 TaxID=2250581 RepID=UPI001313F72E|nr:GtrA family protein [Blastococcus sp. TBT05-19]